MRKIRYIQILIMIMSANIAIGQTTNAPIEHPAISLTFYQAQTNRILQALADHRQMNLIVDNSLDYLQTVKLHDIDWNKALDIITQNAKLQYHIEGNLLTIKPIPDPKILLEHQLQIEKEKELNQPLIYHSVSVNYADPASIASMITAQKILSHRGSILMDKKSNRLIIYDIEKNISAITSLISLLDKPVPQVHILAHIVTMSSESATELGIKWGYQGSSSQLMNQFDINLGVANPTAKIGFNLAKRSGNLLNLELSALEAENQLEIIASPNLLTSDKHTASIKQGTEIPYEVSNGNNGSTSIEFKQAVLGLEVTPRILTNNQMELTLYITQNTTGRSIKQSDGGEALAIDTQEIRTQVFVRSGETLVLGGIFQQSTAINDQAVPGLSKVPIIGGLFQYNGKKSQKRELVIFITPKLVSF